mmetsp:Transcript_87724/g.204116  ORF Transcript_87724/g.204116 Transcript_87724/m.204116 type:complete len:205 (-) Transcript_87724:384-998(-)
MISSNKLPSSVSEQCSMRRSSTLQPKRCFAMLMTPFSARRSTKGPSTAEGITSTSLDSTWFPCADSYSSTLCAASSAIKASRRGPRATSNAFCTRRVPALVSASRHATLTSSSSTLSHSEGSSNFLSTSVLPPGSRVSQRASDRASAGPEGMDGVAVGSRGVAVGSASRAEAAAASSAPLGTSARSWRTAPGRRRCRRRLRRLG